MDTQDRRKLEIIMSSLGMHQLQKKRMMHIIDVLKSRPGKEITWADLKQSLNKDADMCIMSSGSDSHTRKRFLELINKNQFIGISYGHQGNTYFFHADEVPPKEEMENAAEKSFLKIAKALRKGLDAFIEEMEK